MSYKLEQLEKIIGIQKQVGKVRKEALANSRLKISTSLFDKNFALTHNIIQAQMILNRERGVLIRGDNYYQFCLQTLSFENL